MNYRISSKSGLHSRVPQTIDNEQLSFSSFGVCCVFTYKESGDTITQNCSYIQNPNFPSALDELDNVRYTIEKCSDGEIRPA